MLPQKKSYFLYVYMLVILLISSIFLSIHMGIAHKELLKSQDIEESKITFLMDLNSGTQHMSEKPFDIFPLDVAYFKYTPTFVFIIVLIVLSLYIDERRNEHANANKAQGSAKWNTDYKNYNKKFTDPPESPKNDGPRNMILSKNVFLSMDTHQTFLNNCVLIVGGSGSGKTRYEIKPNLLQANCSYVITDPSGELLASTGAFLEKEGYEIKIFNLVEMSKSNCYNPFEYIRDEQGVITLVNCLIQNTNNGKSGGDPFWEKSETALLTALILYLKYHRKKEEQNFATVMKLLRIAQVDEDNPNSQSPLDKIFEIIGRKNPNDIAYKNYMTFKMGAGKTLKSILISCAVRLNAFNLPVIENLTSSDTLELQSLGDKKQALFVIIPAADDTFNYLVSMMYSQLFETLYFHAEVECPKGYYIHNSDGTMNCFQYTKEDAENFIKTHPGCTIKKGDKRVAHHVRFMLDEFANIGQIPSFEKKLATMRKYELSCTIILQNLAQLKTLYKDASEDIIGNCDSFVFLGGKSFDTLEYISKMLGKTTITVRNNSRSRGKSGSSSLSFNSTGRELLNPNEISLIKGTECIILIRGVNPFYDTKYDYTKHKNYQYTGDANSDYIYKISIDNSKKPDIEEIENEIEQDKKNEVIQEMDQVQNIKDFVQNEKIMPRNIQKRFSLEQPEETKDGYIAQSNEKNQKREMEKQKNLSTLQKGPNLKSKIENQTPSEASSSSEKTNKELDDIMIKVCGPNTVIKHSDGVTYDGEFLNGPQPDFSEQRDLSYQEIAKNENKYNNRQSPHNKSQHKNNQKNKKYNNAKQNKKTITKENTNSSFDFSSENKNNIVTPDVPNAENVTPDVVEPGYIETTDAMLGFFDDNCFNG